MKNQNKSIVYTYSSWAILTIHIIFPLYLLLFCLFLFSSSYYKFATLLFYAYFSHIKKVISLSQFFHLTLL